MLLLKFNIGKLQYLTDQSHLEVGESPRHYLNYSNSLDYYLTQSTMFKRQKDSTTDQKTITFLKLSMSYADYCADACLNDFNAGLTHQEKKCLAKCMDRATDFLKLADKKINVPVNIKS